MVALWIILGIAIGTLIGYLLADRRARGAATEVAIAKEQARQTAEQLAAAQQVVGELRLSLAAEQQDRASLDAQLVAANETSEQHRLRHVDTLEQLRCADERHAALVAKYSDEQARHAVTAAQLEAEKKSLAESREHFADAKNRVREAFVEVSNEALQKNTQHFLELAQQKFKTLQTEASGSLEEKKSQIAALLQPLAQQLEQYKQNVEKIELARGEAYTSLSQQLAGVAATQQNLSVETKQLVAALRKPQGRGQWGELTLKRLFEMAGMAARVTFVEQKSVDTEDGKLRPDCIVTLPGSRQVVVDSKCVLDAFLDASAAADDEQRALHLARHARQVKSRVDDLASKAYWANVENTTDYVIMFLPGEAFLYAAVELDPQLVEYSLNRKVLIASPTTLLGLLSVIAHSWRQSLIEKNASEIREAADELYKRVAKLAEHFDKLGGALNKATRAYNDTLGSLEGRVFTQARKLADMEVGGGRALDAVQEATETVRDRSARSWAQLPPPPGFGDSIPSIESVAETLAELTLAESAALEVQPVPSAEA